GPRADRQPAIHPARRTRRFQLPAYLPFSFVPASSCWLAAREPKTPCRDHVATDFARTTFDRVRDRSEVHVLDEALHRRAFTLELAVETRDAHSRLEHA